MSLKNLSYVLNLLKFAFGKNKLLYFSIVVSVCSVVIEILAMSSLLPLFELVSGQKSEQSGYIVKILSWLNIPVMTTSLLWCFIVLFSLRIFTLVVGQTLSMFLGRRILAQLGSQAYSQIINKISLTEINKNSIGFYTSLAGDEAFRASVMIVNLTQFISAAALSILYFYAIAHYSKNTALLIVIFFVACALALFKVFMFSHRLGGEKIEQSRSTNSSFIDGINNLKSVRAFNAEPYVSGIYRNKLYEYTKTLFFLDEIQLLTKFIPVIFLIISLAVWFLFRPHAVAEVGIAFVVTMIVYLMRFFPVVGQGVNLLHQLVSDAKSGKDVTAVIMEHASEDDRLGVKFITSPIKTITLNDLSFAYHGVLQPTFEKVNYEFHCGNSYALVGPSGIGKSTLIDLVLKFLVPTEGTVFFNGDNIVELNPSQLRNKVLLVSQEAAIFDDTVFNNICMGIEATLQQVKTACKLACIDDVIESMERGYQTRLQYQGKNISGGQRQRIAIARALLRIPDVLILDESTSALDKATQEEVISNILHTYANKIVIFITHDPMVAEKISYKFDLSKHHA